MLACAVPLVSRSQSSIFRTPQLILRSKAAGGTIDSLAAFSCSSMSVLKSSYYLLYRSCALLGTGFLFSRSMLRVNVDSGSKSCPLPVSTTFGVFEFPPSGRPFNNTSAEVTSSRPACGNLIVVLAIYSGRGSSPSKSFAAMY